MLDVFLSIYFFFLLSCDDGAKRHHFDDNQWTSCKNAVPWSEYSKTCRKFSPSNWNTGQLFFMLAPSDWPRKCGHECAGQRGHYVEKFRQEQLAGARGWREPNSCKRSYENQRSEFIKLFMATTSFSENFPNLSKE